VSALRIIKGIYVLKVGSTKGIEVFQRHAIQERSLRVGSIFIIWTATI